MPQDSDFIAGPHHPEHDRQTYDDWLVALSTLVEANGGRMRVTHTPKTSGKVLWVKRNGDTLELWLEPKPAGFPEHEIVSKRVA